MPAVGAVVVEVVGAVGAAELLAAVPVLAAVEAAAAAGVVVAGGETWGPVTVVAGLEAEG